MLTREMCLRCFDVCRFIAGVFLIWIVIGPIPGPVEEDRKREEIP